MATLMYASGVVGNMGGGLIEIMTLNWIPLFHQHSGTYIFQILIGLSFTAIYFFVFRFLIVKLDIATPGREKTSSRKQSFIPNKITRQKAFRKRGVGQQGR